VLTLDSILPAVGNGLGAQPRLISKEAKALL